jgi:hypothetical protein
MGPSIVTTVRLTPEQLETLEAFAAGRGVTRSGALRLLVDGIGGGTDDVQPTRPSVCSAQA